MKIVAVLVAVTVAACLSTPDRAGTDASVIDAPLIDTASTCTDVDLDGWYTCGTYPDCFDDDVDRHPGAFYTAPPALTADRDCDLMIPGGVFRVPVNVEEVTGGDDAIEVTTQTARYELRESSAYQLGQIYVGLPATSTPILYTATDNNERFSGVHLWQESFSAQATNAVHTAEILGRGVARIRVNWSHMNLTAGISTYTFVADGRVIRTDAFTTIPNSASSLTDYVAFVATLFTDLRWEESSGVEHDYAVSPPGTPDTGMTVGLVDGVNGFLCARLPGTREVGFAAIDPNAGGRGLRSTVGRTASNGLQFALQYDWRFVTIPDMPYAAHTMIWAGVGGAGNCAETELRARPFLDPVDVVVVSPGQRDGDGFVEDGGYFSMAANAGSVRFQLMGGGGTFGPNNLFRITGLSPTAADPVVLRGTTRLVHGRDYFADFEGDTLWLYTMVSFGTDMIEVISPRASCPTCGS